ncbi:MAG: hypothetical protein WAJ96_06260 [Candidatus Acidiferrum sp.]
MSSSGAKRAQEDSLQREPFTRLVRHSIERVLYGGGESGELDFGIGAMLAVLAVPGAFASIVASPADEYFFIVLAMVATSAVAIWKWDALIPDRRDYVNLAPLPIPAKHILYANLTTLLLLAAALGFDVNAASCVLFPLIAVGSHSSYWFMAMFFATHLFSVFLASMFSFFIVLVILGLMMAVLPYRGFRRCSVYVRCTMVAFLMAGLSTSFEMSAIVQHPSLRSEPLVQLLPPVWFLGLCQHLRGLTDPAFGMLAKTAILASVAALALAVAAYALGYRRCFTKSAESIANFPAVGAVIRHRRGHRATDLFLRTPFERGCFSFTLKALFRSENHMLIVGGFAGVGIVLASETLFKSASAGGANGSPSAELLSIPLIALYLLLVGLRFSFEIPVMQRANWIFRVRTNPDANDCVGLARKVMLTFLIPPLLVIALPAYGFVWGWRVGVIHTAVVAAALMLLVEILLVSFRKIPFTCSAPHFKSDIPISGFFYLVGFIVFTFWVPIIEQRASDDPLWYLGFILALTGIWLGLALYRREMTRFDSQLIFEERSDIGDVAIEVLNLSWVARDTERTLRGGQQNGY